MDTTPLIHSALPASYRLRLQGRLSVDWTDWLSNPIVTVEGHGPASIMTVTGTVPDQAALFGLLSFIRDLGLAIISIEYLPESNMDKEEK